MRFELAEVARAVRGGLSATANPSVVVDGVSIDSRTVRPGQLFVPIVGDRDGHEFVDAARAAGAVACLTARPTGAADEVVVSDTAEALTALGRHARRRLTVPVVGITGSAGKTSTKDQLAAVLARGGLVGASERSFNNELGVPLTLCNAPDEATAVVVEMGARGVGHVAKLCASAHPTVGIVTIVAPAHLELFGSLARIALGKGEMVEALDRNGLAVLNGDDERVRAMVSRTVARVLLYGTAADDAALDVRAEDVRIGPDLRARFLLRTPWGDAPVALGARGRHQVGNALAAASAALGIGRPLDDVVTGLGEASLSPWRMDLVRTRNGLFVLNDAYNANPASMAAGLRSLAELPARRRIAVLGTMAELGDTAAEAHRQIGRTAAELGLDLVVAVAEPAYGVEVVADADAALARIGPLADGDAVLVKGSRVAGLETLASQVIAMAGGAAGSAESAGSGEATW